jgi:hypothetical protein|tara:strand:+ start:997 stop:2349 length:1353 start_codon:yes stop_codon:yes gene_type:complete
MATQQESFDDMLQRILAESGQLTSDFGASEPVDPIRAERLAYEASLNPQAAAQPVRDVREERLASERVTQPQPNQMPTTQSLQADVNNIKSLADQQNAALQEQQLAALQTPNQRFLNKDQTFMDAFKNPGAGQRQFAIKAGLSLLSSGGTKDLSQRIGHALGAGVQGMQAQREKALSKEQQLSKLKLSSLKSKRDAAIQNFGFNRQLTGEVRAENTEVRAQAGNVRAEESSVIAGEANVRAKRKLEIQERGLIFEDQDRALKQDKENQLKSRSNLSIEQYNTNSRILTARDAVISAQRNGITNEMINAMRQSRALAQEQGIPDEDLSPALRAMMEGMFGKATIPNELYNPGFIKQLELASSELYSATGERDFNSRSFADIYTGQSPDYKTDASGNAIEDSQGKPIPAVTELVTKEQIDAVAVAYRKQDPSLSMSEARNIAAEMLRNRTKP